MLRPLLVASVALVLSLATVPAFSTGGTDAVPAGPQSAVGGPGLVVDDAGVSLAAVHSAAARGGFAVSLDGRHAHLVLEPVTDLRAADAPVMDGDTPIAAPAVVLYAGHVAGQLHSHARLGLGPDLAAGYIASEEGVFSFEAVGETLHLVRAERPAGLEVFEDPEWEREQAEVHAREAAHGVTGETGHKQGLTGCLGATPEVVYPPQQLVTGFTPQVGYEIIVDADKTYRNKHGGAWAAMQLLHMNMVDGYFQNNFNIKITVVGQFVDAAGTTYTSSDSSTLLSQARSKWISDPTDRETVHLLVHRDLDGVTVGQAYCIGGAHSQTLHYTVTTGWGTSNFWSSVITAHELGHMMSAHHHYANCAESVLTPGTIDYCTVMINAIDLADNSVVFSTLSRSTIREYGEDVLYV